MKKQRKHVNCAILAKNIFVSIFLFNIYFFNSSLEYLFSNHRGICNPIYSIECQILFAGEKRTVSLIDREHDVYGVRKSMALLNTGCNREEMVRDISILYIAFNDLLVHMHHHI